LVIGQLFLWGLAFGVARVATGTWVAAGFAHFLSNCGTLLPRWSVTFMAERLNAL
jgi:hypothetical protein